MSSRTKSKFYSREWERYSPVVGGITYLKRKTKHNDVVESAVCYTCRKRYIIMQISVIENKLENYTKTIKQHGK